MTNDQVKKWWSSLATKLGEISRRTLQLRKWRLKEGRERWDLLLGGIEDLVTEHVEKATVHNIFLAQCLQVTQVFGNCSS